LIHIFIADDHAIVRAGLKQFIADQADMQVSGEAATGSECIQLVRAGEFDVVLLDISMPDKNGIDTLKTLTPRISTRSTCCARALPATSTRRPLPPSSWERSARWSGAASS
jgi:DNA-binding NarL/FixJ family response regulator